MSSSLLDWNSVLSAAAKEIGCDAVAVFLNRPERNLAERIAFVGEEPRASVPFGVTPLGECAASGTAFHRETKNTKAFKYHSHLYLPLLAKDGTSFGAISFSAVTADLFSGSEVVTRAERWGHSLTRMCLEML